ncbi:hypothetical protein ABZZ17_31510 [Streptomyces sp. NPDC006512]
MWLTDDGELVPLPTDPGGRQPVLFVGPATPVRTPLIGPPLIGPPRAL